MTMKLSIQHVMDATLVISQIIREDRKLPQKGKYRLARMHPKLNKEFATVNAQRDEMIIAYGFHPKVPNPAFNQPAEEGVDVPEFIESPEYAVPADKLEEFQAKWSEFADQEIEINIEPIPLEQLCFPGDAEDGSITAHEFIILGDLVKE